MLYSRNFWSTLLLIYVIGINAQSIPEKGIPLIENFTTNNYENQGKIWDIKSAPNGVVYMACDQGLMSYDGQNWKHFEGSKGNTRSLWVVNDSMIFTGSDFDFGVWQKSAFKDFKYTSLYPFKEDANGVNEEFWDVYQLKDRVIFVSFNNIYLYQDDRFTKIAAPFKFNASYLYNGKVYLSDEKYGLFSFDGKTLIQVVNSKNPQNIRVVGLYENEGKLAIVTRNHGLFTLEENNLVPITNNITEDLKRNQVFSYVNVHNKYHVFGTILNGIYITDRTGKIIQHINRQNGLINNTILSMYYNPFGQLWVGMDYGAAVLDLSSKYSYFIDYQGRFGTGYTALLKENDFYLGTNQGLYSTHWDELSNGVRNLNFNLIPKSEGQVWDVQNIEGSILCGHDHGLFELKAGNFNKLWSEPGVWTIVPFRNEYVLTGNYNGISAFKKENGQWTFLKKIDLIYGSCNQLKVESKNVLWVNIPKYGFIRVTLNDQLYPVQRKTFLSDKFQGEYPSLVQKDNKIYVYTTNWQYEFNPKTNKFDPKNTIPNTINIKEIMPGIYQPYWLNKNYSFYPINNGFALENNNFKPLETAKYSLVVNYIQAFNNRESKNFNSEESFPYRLNNLRVSCMAPQQKHALYQYKLDGLNNQWSSWKSTNEFSFFNLQEGNYKLWVKAKIGDTIVEAKPISFKISAPWYRKWYAILLYLLILGGIIYAIHQRQNIKLKKQKKELLKKEQKALRTQAAKYREQVLMEKQKLLEEEQKQLKNSLRNKTIELAKQAKDSKDKNRLLRILYEKMEEMKTNPSLSKKRLTEMRRLIENYLEKEDQVFEMQMDDIHQEFYKQLRQDYPDLSLYELRLSAYLKIGLNSKEISEILQVLPSSINVSRSRLRKKLQLESEEDLYEFFNEIDK